MVAAAYIIEHNMTIRFRNNDVLVYGTRADFDDFMYIAFEYTPVHTFYMDKLPYTVYSYHNTDDCCITRKFDKGYRILNPNDEMLEYLYRIDDDIESRNRV